MSDACIQHLHTHRWPYWHDLRGGRTEPEDLVGGDTQSGPGSDLAAQAGRRRSCWPASAARERSQPSGAGAGIGSGGGELLRGRVRRILAASAVDRGWDYEFCVRSGQHCGGAAQPAGEDGPPRRRAVAAHADGALLRSEEHTSELQSPDHLVCRLLLEKKKHCASTKSYSQSRPEEGTKPL